MLCTHKTKPEIVVPVVRVVVVAIRGTQVLRVAVPTATTNNAVRPGVGHSPKKDCASQILGIGMRDMGDNTSHTVD